MASLLYHVTLLAVILRSACSAPAPMSDDSVMNFLKRYGYLEKSRDYQMEDQSVKEALMNFKHMYGVKNPSDVMDSETRAMMQMPRCGVPDVKSETMEWSKLHLTYDVKNYSLPIAVNEFDRVLEQALSLWSGASDLTFERKRSGPVDIEIGFASGDHGDSNPFDGRGEILAHAFYPERGVFHFDTDENWSITGDGGTDVLHITAHEFGHLLGLGHSDEVESVMAPMYNGFKPNLKLHSDDIMGIQYLYGPKITDGHEAPPQPDKYSLCEDPSIDASFASTDRRVYFFKGMQFWEIHSNGSSLVDGYPQNINTRWRELPHSLDAALYSNKNSRTYFFKGMMVWRYKDLKLDAGFPKKMAEEFPGMFVNSLDAAVEWSGDGNLHFFKNGKHWCYDGRRVCADYPKSMSMWGLPDKIDAAIKFYYHGYRTYFFKGTQFYRFHDRTMKVLQPTLNTRINWLGCPP